LGSLLNVVIVKLRYDEETEWGNDEDEPEEEALFFEMRKVNIFIWKKKIGMVSEVKQCQSRCVEFENFRRTYCHDQRGIICWLYSFICNGHFK
jgi:hypothetical protein